MAIFSYAPAIQRTVRPIKMEEIAGKLLVPEKNTNWLIWKKLRPVSIGGRALKPNECTNHLSALITFRHGREGLTIKEDAWGKIHIAENGLNKKVEMQKACKCKYKGKEKKNLITLLFILIIIFFFFF